MPSRVYVCDADSLINLHRHFGRQAITVLKRLAKNGQLKLPEGVVRELIRGTDRLARFAKKERDSFEVLLPRNTDLSKELARLERLYGEWIKFGKQTYAGFWKSKSGKRAADAQVVAVAKVLNVICVSDDRAVKLACALENVECIGWMELARQVGLSTQLEFNF